MKKNIWGVIRYGILLVGEISFGVRAICAYINGDLLTMCGCGLMAIMISIETTRIMLMDDLKK